MEQLPNLCDHEFIYDNEHSRTAFCSCKGWQEDIRTYTTNQLCIQHLYHVVNELTKELKVIKNEQAVREDGVADNVTQ